MKKMPRKLLNLFPCVFLTALLAATVILAGCPGPDTGPDTDKTGGAGPGTGQTGDITDAKQPVILQQPEGRACVIGGAVEPLSVEASSPDGGTLSYQWFTKPYLDSDPTAIPDGTGETYAPPVDEVGVLYYYVEVTNTNNKAGGNKTAMVQSDIVSVTVSSNPPITGFTFTQTAGLQEGSANVNPGNIAGTFSEVVGGTGTDFIWEMVTGEGSDDNNLFVIDGADLKIVITLTVGARKVRVRVTDVKNETYEKVCTVGVMSAAPTDAALKLQYTFDAAQEDGYVDDKTGTYTGALKNGASLGTVGGIGVLQFDNSGEQYFDLSSDAGAIIKDSPDAAGYTVSAYILAGPDAYMSGSGWWPWVFSSVEEAAGTKSMVYYQVRTNSMEVDVSSDSTRVWVWSGNGMPNGQWVHVLFTQSSAVGTLYFNGQQIAQRGDVPLISDLNASGLTYNWLGRTPWEGNAYMRDTKYADFRVYNKALSAAEVAALDVGTTLQILNSDESIQNALTNEILAYKESLETGSGVFTADAMKAVMVNLPKGNGLVLVSYSSDKPGVIASDGVVTRPSATAGDATVTVTATYSHISGGKSVTATYVLTVPAEVRLDTPLFSMTVENSALVTSAGKAAAVGTGFTYTDGPDGGTDNAVILDNVSRYIKVTKDDDTPLLAGVESFTVSFWVKRNSGANSWLFWAAPDDRKLVWPPDPPEQYIGILYNNGNRRLECERFFNGRGAPAAHSIVTANNVIANNNTTWYHIAYVAAPNYSAVYLNGNQIGSAACETPVTTILNGEDPVLYIGRGNWTANGEGANCAIYSYKIYNGVLTPAQIAAQP